MNELKYSDSPYLLQHADNPVHWMEWGERAFEKAKSEDKLIFLSIGYSTCHWCHVMERESFENEEIANILNRHFVSIKVDREELVDVDKYYQKVYQLMHKRGGGWPLTIIMTPDKKPIFSATYIPPTSTHFSVGLKELLLSIANDWREKREKLEEIGSNFIKYFKENEYKEFVVEDIDNDLIEKIISEFEKSFDYKFGGVKGAPKFPMESMLDLLIDIYEITKNQQLFEKIDFTLTSIAKSGLFDQVEGGFFRYSTDERWEIPHFEKMLYNSANLSKVYLRFYEISNKEIYKDVAFRSIDEMLIRYRDKSGLFFSASNAESEGVEGKYFMYEFDEVEKEFSKFENRDELLSYFNIHKYGNFNGRNHIVISDTKRPQNYEDAIEVLKKLRKKREFPFIDTKKITSWNSMMVDTLFFASKFKEEYKKEALITLNSIFKYLYEGKLYHSFNKKEKKEALLEDFAFLIKALITAYEYSFDEEWLKKIEVLLQEVMELKGDKWYMSKKKEVLADFSDSAYSSSLSIMANNFLDLSLIFYDVNLKKEADFIIGLGSSFINRYPLYYSTITKAYLKSKKAFIIKSPYPLYKEKFSYPYVLWSKADEFEVCTFNSCLLRSKDLQEVKKLLK